MRSIFLAVAAIGVSLLVNAQQKKPIYLDLSKPIEERVENAVQKGVSRLGIPEVWTDDSPHGIREEVLWDEWVGANWINDSCTAFPALTCLSAMFNPKLSLLYGTSIEEEARYRDKTLLLGHSSEI